jgi:hypothetical protein
MENFQPETFRMRVITVEIDIIVAHVAIYFVSVNTHQDEGGGSWWEDRKEEGAKDVVSARDNRSANAPIIFIFIF